MYDSDGQIKKLLYQHLCSCILPFLFLCQHKKKEKENNGCHCCFKKKSQYFMKKFGHFWTNFLAIKILLKHSFKQHANKIMSSSPWLRLVDFALRLVNSVIHFLNLHDGLVNFLENSNHRRTVFRALQKFSLGFRCMHLKWLLGYYILSTLYMCNLPRWQAVKLTFLHPV